MSGEWLVRAGLALLRLLAKLPFGVLRGIGVLAGDLIWVLARPRRRITLTNLRLCFPGWTEARRRAVARAHFAPTRAASSTASCSGSSRGGLRALVELRGLEHFQPWLGKLVILLAPHFVGLDAGGMRYQADFPGASMYANQKSRVLTEAMTAGATASARPVCCCATTGCARRCG
jgi:KDO2-lipid IV(A) lauroyltransferase